MGSLEKVPAEVFALIFNIVGVKLALANGKFVFYIIAFSLKPTTHSTALNRIVQYMQNHLVVSSVSLAVATHLNRLACKIE